MLISRWIIPVNCCT